MQPPNVNLRQIASAAGASLTTVSLALRKHPSISAQTRARIEEIAAELGYRPNPLVSALMRHKRSTRREQNLLPIAVVTNLPQPEPWKQGVLEAELFIGLEKAAEARGYKLEEFWLREPNMTGKRLSQILHHRGIPGMIVFPLSVAHGHLSMSWKDFAAVAIGSSLARPKLDRVRTDYAYGIQIALRRLRGLGYRRVGLCLPAADNARSDGRWLGSFLSQQATQPSSAPLAPFIATHQEWNLKNFKNWMEIARPDAVLSTEGGTVMHWAETLGMKVPDQLGVVSLVCDSDEEIFSGLNHQGTRIGTSAMDLLLDLIETNQRGIPESPKTILVEPTWREGRTLRPTNCP